jgi:hypothetical protein
MSVPITNNKTLSIDGKPFSQQVSLTANLALRREDVLAAAKVGTLTIRTNNTDGSLTMSAGHGITTGVSLDIYWNVGGVPGSRRGAVVGTVAGNVVPFTGGAGDNLPIATSPITAMIPISFAMPFNGDNVVVIAGTCDAPCTIVFATVDNVERYAIVTKLANQVLDWYQNNGTVNPLLTRAITQVFVTHGDSTSTRTTKPAVALL